MTPSLGQARLFFSRSASFYSHCSPKFISKWHLALCVQGPGCAVLRGEEEEEVWAPGKVPGRDEAEQIAPRVNWSWELHPWSSHTNATWRNLHLPPAWCRWEGAFCCREEPAALLWLQGGRCPASVARGRAESWAGIPQLMYFFPGNSDEFTPEQSPLRLRQPDRMGKNVINVALQHLRHTCLGNSIYPPWKQNHVLFRWQDC